MKKFSYFLLIVFSSFLFLNNYSALINDNYVVDYDYNSPYIYNNFNRDFFDSSSTTGYLTDLSLSIVSQGWSRSWLLGFSKNDLYYFSTSAGTDFAFNIGTYSNNQSVEISPTVSGTYYYYRLSDFSSYASFKEAIINSYTGKRKTYSTTNPFILYSGYNSDLRLSNYNYFTKNINDYFIPFLTNASISNQCVSSRCYNNDIIYQSISINGIDSYVPTYFDFFGLNAPSKDNVIKYTKLFSLDNVIVFNNASWDFSYRLPKSMSNTTLTFEIYTRVENNNLFHFERLDDNLITINHNGSLSCDSSFCYYNFSDSDINLGSYNLDNIYIKAIPSTFNNVLVSSLKFESNGQVPMHWFNNVSLNLMKIWIITSTDHSMLFSTNSTDNVSLYYNDSILDDDPIVSLTPQFYNKSNNTFYTDIIYYTSVNHYYYSFNELKTNQYKHIIFFDKKLSPEYPLGFMLHYDKRNNNFMTYDYQFGFFISRNLYWSYTTTSIDDNTFVGNIIDENGNIQTLNVEYDSSTSIFSNDKFFNGLKEFTDGFLFTNNPITNIILTPFNFLYNVIENNETCVSISIPIPFTDREFNLPCLSNVYNNYIPSVIEIWHIVLWGLVSFGVLYSILLDILNALNPNEDQVKTVSRWLQ